MMEAGRIDVKPLISHRFKLEQAEKAYQLISENKEPYLGIMLEYGARCTVHGAREKEEDGVTGHGAQKNENGGQRSSVGGRLQDPKIQARTIQFGDSGQRSAVGGHAVTVGLIGAGNFTGQVLLPAIAKNQVKLKTIASGGGVTGTHLGKKFGFEQTTTDVETIFTDPDINTVFVTTRHDSHARFVLQALKSGKHVFVEKPLSLTREELDEIVEVYNSSLVTRHSSLLLMVGFNRRFAPHIVKMKQLLDTVKEPKSMIMTVNAGMIPKEHWTQDLEVGGGRIVGEACHFIDLLRFLAGCPITGSRMSNLDVGTGDTASIELKFADGSIGTVHYFANGDKSFPKERLEVFAGGKILQLDNFRVLKGYGWKNFSAMKLWNQDKGHGAEVKAFLEAVGAGGPSPIPFDEIVEVTRVTLEIAGFTAENDKSTENQ
jgi:predicted dehydrogenase